MLEQQSLFDGATYDNTLDATRLTGQWLRVYQVLAGGEWLTLSEIQNAITERYQRHDSQTGISARIRDFRKEKFGSRTVNTRRRGNPKDGVWEYQLKGKD